MNQTSNNRSFRTGLRLVQLLAGILLAILSSQTYAVVEKKVFYHNNLLGSPVAATDENGDLCWREDYRPYGEKIRNEDQGCGLDGNEVGFTGHVHDRDIGLTYMQARYYDPVVGRFMGVDPVGYTTKNPVMSFNRFLYANNNPYKYTDPNGRFVFALPAVIAALEAAYSFVTAVAVVATAVTVVNELDEITGIPSANAVLNENANEEAAGDETDEHGLPTKGPEDDDIKSETKVRDEPGRDGGESSMTTETLHGKTVSTKHAVVNPNGEVVHQHKDFKGKYGGSRQFSDELSGVDSVT